MYITYTTGYSIYKLLLSLASRILTIIASILHSSGIPHTHTTLYGRYRSAVVVVDVDVIKINRLLVD